MWVLNWFDGGGDAPTTPRPPEYVAYKYLGVQTFLTLPEIPLIGQEIIELKPLGIYTLPDDFNWTIRALEEGRLIAV
jgi:hypothetical protein